MPDLMISRIFTVLIFPIFCSLPFKLMAESQLHWQDQGSERQQRRKQLRPSAVPTGHQEHACPCCPSRVSSLSSIPNPRGA